MEREFKFQFEPDAAKQLRGSPLLASVRSEPARNQELVSTYFDTPDLKLHRNGASLRVRTYANDRVQTLKVAGSTQGGFYQRNEFESSVSSDIPDLAVLAERIPENTEVGSLMRDAELRGSLTEVFVTRVQREVSMLCLPHGEEVECVIDEGVIEVGPGSVPINEIELELKSGAPDHLYGFALELLGSVPLTISRLSKGDRGYELLAGKHETSVRAKPIKFNKDDSVEQALIRIVQNCLAQVHGNERGVVSSADPSAVHQMRVGLRRLRSAFDLFERCIAIPSSLLDELKWIAGELGDARDWEVLAGTTLPRVFQNAADDSDVRAVQEASRGIAGQNRRNAASAVNSVRYTRLSVELTRWLDGAGWREGMSDEERRKLSDPIKPFASRTIRGRHRRLIERGRNLAELDADLRHRARIAAKKLRYATEFFASLYPKQAVSHYITSLSNLQDDLGWRNDVAVAEGLLRAIASSRPETMAGAEYARGYLASCVVADYDTLKMLWRRFKRLSSPT
ncbi:CHAD domain-containing protein [Paraburkholderia hospita]|uniref:CYTH and CHAD domain-containing protein n=1 Tax=Paraburkholderia hospita TaxID=169430 RepID=UPI003ED0BA67